MVDVDAGGASRYLKSQTLRFRYDGIDLSKVDESVLVIPALGAVLSVAYALGVAIEVDTVDEEFAACAEELAAIWGAVHSTFRYQGFELLGRRVRNASQKKGDLLLYSGGVDALASLLRNRSTAEGLVSVWGADVPLSREELWQRLQGLVPLTTATHGIPQFVVKTNIKKSVNKQELLDDFFGTRKESWWMKAQHGIALITICAPIAVFHGYSRVLIASSHSKDFHTPWGSAPVTDDAIRWATTVVKHDSFDLTRQQKISDVIAPYIRAGGKTKLAVCYKRKRGGGETINCGECEKCMRTATGAIVAGIDPKAIGIPVDVDAMENWIDVLEKGEKSLSANEIFMWSDVQRGIPGSSHEGLPERMTKYIERLSRCRFPA